MNVYFKTNTWIIAISFPHFGWGQIFQLRTSYIKKSQCCRHSGQNWKLMRMTLSYYHILFDGNIFESHWVIAMFLLAKISQLWQPSCKGLALKGNERQTSSEDFLKLHENPSWYIFLTDTQLFARNDKHFEIAMR